MAEPKANPILITAQPESKIRFLEQSLMGHDWRAEIRFGGVDGLPLEALPHLRNTLLERGYLVAEGHGAGGEPVLAIHHLGEQTKVADVAHEAGQGRGLLYGLTHPAALFRMPLHYGKQGVRWIIGGLQDPARANGIINTSAEVFLMSAGKGAQYGKFTDPKNALLSLAGLSWFGQSLEYMAFGKNNETRAYHHIADKLDQTMKAGGDITQIRFDPMKDSAPGGVVGGLKAFARRFTVPIGSALNNLGMVFYIGQAWLERKHHIAQRALNPRNEAALKYLGEEGARGFRNWIKTGFGKDVFGASLSLIGWSVLMIPPKAPRTESELAQEQTTPLGRFWDKFREHTPMIAGLTTLGASSFRLMGAESRGNAIQKIGERIYIGGDIALMFTNSHEYGGDKKLDPERLSKQLIEDIGQRPVLMDEATQRDWVAYTVQFWLDKNKADMEASKLNRRVPHGIIEESAVEIRQVLTRQLAHQQRERFEHLCENAAEIIARFPQEQRTALVERLGKNLAEQPWIRIGEHEVQAGIAQALAHLPPVKERLLNMKLIANDARSIGMIVPGIDQTACVAAIYDAVAPYTPGVTVPAQQQEQARPHTRITGEVKHVAKGLEAGNDPQVAVAANMLG